MKQYNEIDEWDNPLKDIATRYWRNGFLTEYGGLYEVVLTKDELMLVLGYMMMGMNKVEKLNKEEHNGNL